VGIETWRCLILLAIESPISALERERAFLAVLDACEKEVLIGLLNTAFMTTYPRSKS
jgi:hypothetical protein